MPRKQKASIWRKNRRTKAVPQNKDTCVSAPQPTSRKVTSEVSYADVAAGKTHPANPNVTEEVLSEGSSIVPDSKSKISVAKKVVVLEELRFHLPSEQLTSKVLAPTFKIPKKVVPMEVANRVLQRGVCDFSTPNSYSSLQNCSNETIVSTSNDTEFSDNTPVRRQRKKKGSSQVTRKHKKSFISTFAKSRTATVDLANASTPKIVANPQKVCAVSSVEKQFTSMNIDTFGLVASASRSQDDLRFSEYSRGNQCTAMASFALSFLQVLPSTEWTEAIMDKVLDFGDALYLLSMQTRRPPAPNAQYTQYLTVDEIASRFTFSHGDQQVGVEFVYPGNFAIEDDDEGDRADFLHTAEFAHQITRFFEKHQVGIFVAALTTIAIWKEANTFFVFDSHSRNYEGLVQADGTACLLRFRDVGELLNHLGNLYRLNTNVQQATIHQVNVSVTRDLSQWVAVPKLQPVVAVSRAPPITSAPKMFQTRRAPAPITPDTPTRVLRSRVVTPTTSSSKRRFSDLGIHDAVERQIKAVRRPNLHDPFPSQDSFDGIMEYLPALIDEFCYPDEINAESVEEHKLPSMSKECGHCGALKYPAETYLACCKQGDLNLPTIHENFPDFIKSLLLGEHPLSKEFFKNARGHNNQLAMATTQASTNHVPGVYNPCIAIEGTMYHTVHQVDMQRSHTAAFYYVDFDNMKENMDPNAPVPINDFIIREVRQILLQINCFARMYEHMGNLKRQNPGNNYYISFHNVPGVNRSTHNKPTNLNEVGAVFESIDGDEMPPPGEYRIYEKVEGVELPVRRNISPVSPITDPLCFPFLFPEGELGWDINVPRLNQGRIKRKRVTFKEFWAYRLHVRKVVNLLLEAGKLTQAFFISVWIRVEDERCNFLKNNQEKLRVSEYSGLIDYVHRKNEDLAAINGEAVPRPGKLTILPSSFVGGRRYMQAKYQDAMTIVSKFGKPTYFLTFTTNPQWEEIQNFVRHSHKTVQDRPDITARVFYAKFQHLMEYLLSDKSHLGKVVAYVIAFEFQKRGLPHAHVLLTVDDFSKPKNGDDIDRVISAEIPDPAKYPRLHALVARTMMHHPCGLEYPDAICMVNGKCSKNFPKRHAGATVMSSEGKVLYRRRMLDQTVDVRTSRGNTTVPLGNAFVVEYDPRLLMRYNCHFNVQIVTEFTAPKYLFKYITKGQDHATITVDKENGPVDVNEVKEYIETRYTTSGCAAWRMFELPLVKMSHTVDRLPVHLPDQQNVFFSEGNEEQAALRAESRNSKLMAFFELNRAEAHARQFTYNQIPEHYRFVGNKWVRRVRYTKLVSRIFMISPRDVERFHLRILLLHVTGPTSFDDLLTVDGHRCATFEESARLRNLIINDEVWEKTLNEAEQFQMPGQMRKLFGNLLCYCNVRNGPELFDKFKVALSADYVHRGMQQEAAERRALLRIAGYLRHLGRNISDFNFHIPNLDEDIVFDDNILDPRSVEDNMSQFLIEALNNVEQEQADYNRLNQQQRLLYDTVVRAVKSREQSNRCFYLQGCGGTGKTFVYNAILQRLECENVPTLAVAFTGIAALLLKNGQTSHSAFGLPILVDKQMRSFIKGNSEKADYLRNVQLIVWDEISMVSQYIINCVDTLLRDVRNNNTPFGGVCMLFGGDIRQLLCVAPQKIDQIEQLFCKCRAWPHFTTFELTENMRTGPEEVQFSDWLLKVGNGEINHSGALNNVLRDCISLPRECLVDDVVSEIYGSLDMTKYTPQLSEAISDCAVLCPLNENCDRINQQMLAAFPGETTVYLSVDQVDSSDPEEVGQYPEEFLNSVKLNNLPLHKLELKTGVPVILMKNISVRDGLTNGTRMIVTDTRPNLIVGEIITGRFKGNKAMISRQDMCVETPSLPFKLKRRQFPLKLCFALTINKSQGQTFDKVGIYLHTPAFSHGQLYVALSRVKKQSSIKMQVTTGRLQGKLLENSENIYTKNVVYKEIYRYIWPNRI